MIPLIHITDLEKGKLNIDWDFDLIPKAMDFNFVEFRCYPKVF